VRKTAMKNVEYKVEKKRLIIEIDLTKDFGPSESGKTIIIASTNGSQKIGYEDAVLGLNVFKKNPKFEKK
jgi:hypothetical protein